ncbi:MAG: hypothetical protein AB7J46_03025 [Candidatus Altimarinota bacterium]
MSTEIFPDLPRRGIAKGSLESREDDSISSVRASRIAIVRQAMNTLLLRRRSMRASSDTSHFSQENDPWLIRYCNILFSSNESLPVSDLIVSGMLQPNIYSPDDYVSGRKLPEYEERLGCSFAGFHQVIEERVERQHLFAMEIGPGDGLSLNELRKLHPNWQYSGMGDRLFFSIEKLLHQTLKPLANEHDEEFMRLFFIFIRREFRMRLHNHSGKDPRQQKFIDLNELYSILLEARDWLSHHFDSRSGTYMVSEEFEFDERRQVSPQVKRRFMQLLSTNKPLHFYTDFFADAFIQALASGSQSFDLHQYVQFSSKGFICMRFQEMDRLLNANPHLRRRIHFLYGCRSDSHLGDEEYAAFLTSIFEMMAPGAVYLSDGHKRSYNRKLRFAAIRHALSQHEGMRALVVVDKASGSPKSICVERGMQKGSGFEYLCRDQLKGMFPTDDFIFQPLDEIEGQFLDLDKLIQDILVENGGDFEAFRGINDYLSRVHEYMRKGLNPYELIEQFRGVNDERAILVSEIALDLFDIRLEHIRKRHKLPDQRLTCSG